MNVHVRYREADLYVNAFCRKMPCNVGVAKDVPLVCSMSSLLFTQPAKFLSLELPSVEASSFSFYSVNAKPKWRHRLTSRR